MPKKKRSLSVLTVVLYGERSTDGLLLPISQNSFSSNHLLLPHIDPGSLTSREDSFACISLD